MARLDQASPDTLSLDLSNPRIPDARFTDEEEAIFYLYTQADLGELIQSIGNSGWLDFEPLIVEESTRTVIEGNRRLAALRIIASPRLQQQFKLTLPQPLHINAMPSEVQVNYVGSRKEARDFIGFKHVNGAFKWDSYAKARFAHSWLQDGDDIDDIRDNIEIVRDQLSSEKPKRGVLRSAVGFLKSVNGGTQFAAAVADLVSFAMSMGIQL